MSNSHEYHLAYARKHRSKKLVEKIKTAHERKGWENKTRIQKAKAFREAIKTARQAGNREMERRIRMQYAKMNDVVIS